MKAKVEKEFELDHSFILKQLRLIGSYSEASDFISIVINRMIKANDPEEFEDSLDLFQKIINYRLSYRTRFSDSYRMILANFWLPFKTLMTYDISDRLKRRLIFLLSQIAVKAFDGRNMVKTECDVYKKNLITWLSEDENYKYSLYSVPWANIFAQSSYIKDLFVLINKAQDEGIVVRNG